MRSRYPFLMYGGLGAVIFTAFAFALTPALAKLYASAGRADLTKEFVPVLGALCLITAGIPIGAGLLAARSSGSAFVGALAGGLVYVGHDIILLALAPVVAPHAATPLDPTSVGIIGCQGVFGLFFGVLGGLVGRRFYRERPSDQGFWAPSPDLSHGSYGPGANPGSWQPPNQPYGPPPTYGASYNPTPYAPPRYQPGASLPPSAYPAPGYAPPTHNDGRGGPAPGASGTSWNQGWPASGDGEQPNEDASGSSWYGWPPPTR